MEPIHQNDSTVNRPEGARVLNANVVRISLPKYYRQVRSEPAWEKSERNAITLFHNDRMRIVLIALKPGGEVPSHSVDGPCSIQVQQGRVWVETEDESVSLDEGEAVALGAQLEHSIHAEEESMILLTIAGDENGNF